MQGDAIAALNFDKIVNYGKTANSRQIVPHTGNGTESGNSAFFDSIATAAVNLVITQTSTDMSYLNAWNAPHWMTIGQLAGWYNNQTGTYPASTAVETYGTSWLRDLMVAKNYAPATFQQPQSLFNGATDANLGFTPFQHGTHDMGMAFDLGIKNSIDALHQNTPDPVVLQQVSQAHLANWGHWSNTDAQALMDLMIQTPGNRQNKVLGDFFSLYSVTQKQGGSRDALTAQISGSSDASNKEKELNGLFGNGTQAGGLIQGVIVGAPGKNTYPNMHAALEDLGFVDLVPGQSIDTVPYPIQQPTLQRLSSHQNHFHIYLQAPGVVSIDPASPTSTQLNVEAPATATAAAASSAIMLAGNTQNQLTPAMVQQIKNELQDQDQTCIDVGNAALDALAGGKMFDSNVNPGLVVAGQLANFGIKVLGPINVRITQQPKHGTITVNGTSAVNLGVSGNGIESVTKDNYLYTPDKTYQGIDTATFEIKVNGYTFRMSFEFHVLSQLGGPDPCPTGAEGDVNLQITPGSIELIANDSTNPLPENMQTWLRNEQIATLLNDSSTVSIAVADLPGSAVAQTTGEAPNATITLDTNAAGYGWYTDPNQAANTDFLPTSNPNVWIAAPGSAAAGKMDMLSVLLHEYGHAIGLDHSANPNDFMAPDLQPGERRLPSAAELALMSQLVVQLQPGSTTNSPVPDSPTAPTLPIGAGLSALLVGRLRRTGYGSLSTVIDSAQIPAPQLELAVNPTLVGLDSPIGWTTNGKVVTDSTGTATLKNSTSADAQLTQAFNITSSDRYLEFTVANGLQQNGSGPADAFEVALDNAVTGTALVGTDGLTNSDGLLNIQADGTTRSASSVYKSINVDGTTTYVIDLQSALGSGAVTGTPAALSFDLIGFGNSHSQVSIKDIKLLQTPLALNESVTTNEDVPVNISPLAANAVLSRATPLVNITQNPTNGVLTQNADGSYSYVPNAHFFGSDSFQYSYTVNGESSNAE